MRGPDPLRLLVIVALTAALGVKVLFWLEDGPRRRRPEPLHGTASVTGLVLDDIGQPVGGGRVRAYVPGEPAPFHSYVETSGDGSFAVENVPAGLLSLAPQHGGYVSPRYMTDEVIAYVDVTDGQQVGGVRLVLVRGGRISGRVVHADGRPLANRLVHAIRYIEGFDGAAFARSLPGDRTDDNGEYRIDRVPPGDYHVRVSLTADDAAVVYYPRTHRLEHAKTVSVRGRADVADLDITVDEVPRSTISGRVSLAGGPPRRVMVSLLDAGSTAPARLRTVTPDAEGRFRIEDVPAGRFQLVGHPGVPSEPPPDPAWSGWAIEEVVTDGHTPLSASLELERGVTFTGQVLLDDPATTDRVASTPVWVVGTDAASAIALATGAGRRPQVGEDGALTFGPLPPGRYRLMLPQANELWPIAVEIDGEARPDAVLELALPDEVPSFVATVGSRPTLVRGVLRDEAGAPAPGRFVVVFPADPALWHAGPGYVGTAFSGPTGAFEVRGLLPGDYIAASLEAGSGYPAIVRATLERLRRHGVAISLERSGRLEVALVAQGR